MPDDAWRRACVNRFAIRKRTRPSGILTSSLLSLLFLRPPSLIVVVLYRFEYPQDVFSLSLGLSREMEISRSSTKRKEYSCESW